MFRKPERLEPPQPVEEGYKKSGKIKQKQSQKHTSWFKIFTQKETKDNKATIK
jgi:hypothetical protein